MIRLAAFFVLLQVLDVASTLVGLAAGAAEQNPIGAAALRGGPWLLLVAKMAGTALILYVAARVHEGGEKGRS